MYIYIYTIYIYIKKPTSLLHGNTEPLETEKYCDSKLI